MRQLLGVAGAWVLVLLFAGTTPFGTDDAAHRDLLLHPLWPHLHLVDGHLVLHAPHAARPTAPAATPRSPGPALGAATGASLASAGLALTPPLPNAAAPRSARVPGRRLLDEDQPLPAGRAEAPPDPPPTRAHA